MRTLWVHAPSAGDTPSPNFGLTKAFRIQDLPLGGGLLAPFAGALTGLLKAGSEARECAVRAQSKLMASLLVGWMFKLLSNQPLRLLALGAKAARMLNPTCVLTFNECNRHLWCELPLGLGFSKAVSKTSQERLTSRSLQAGLLRVWTERLLTWVCVKKRGTVIKRVFL